LLLFAYSHLVNASVLKIIFETKIEEIPTSPDIPMFKKFRENWKNINSSNIEPSLNFVTARVAETDIQALLIFSKAELDKDFVRDDYRELTELCVTFSR